jgi:hypothetical protein
LILDEQDEIALIREMHWALEDRQLALELPLIRALGCNFRCQYCFSYTRPERMGAEIQEALLRFVEQKLGEAERLSAAHPHRTHPSLRVSTPRHTALAVDPAKGRLRFLWKG